MTLSKAQKVVALIEIVQTRDLAALEFLHPTAFIQHGPSIRDGKEGLREWLTGLPKTARAAPARVFEDGEFVFAHTDYEVFGPKIGFDVFRFERDVIVEHWDCLQEAVRANPSGHSMIDGETVLRDLDKTESNKRTVATFMQEMLAGRADSFANYFDGDRYIQHNAWFPDQLSGTMRVVTEWTRRGVVITYDKVHRILGQGNFVLAASECTFKGVATAFYDMWRLEDGKLAEHWDVVEAIPPRDRWLNQHEKF
jgi:predicted SnoaL-like aldol condensation-catalyzing enzyme